MAYNYPTEEGIKYAIEQGWSKEEAERGFTIFDFDGTGMLEVEAITDCYIKDDYDDNEAAIEAERIGFCKIIPVNELPDPFIYDGNSRRYFGWVDTPENRKRIKDYCKKTTNEYVVRVTETFDKLIVVKANSKKEAIQKCNNKLQEIWNKGGYIYDSPVTFNYLMDNSDINYTIGTIEDEREVFFQEDKYEHLD